jgi:two-component system, OmpR family, phosphate regulon response regulator OmpR
MVRGDRVHIVVVDDEPDIRETVREYLSLHGFRVTAASGGQELRKILEESSVQLAILDIAMPGEDGLSLARFLREHHKTAIMMLTAAGEVVDRIIGLEMGADDYMAKPVDLRELLARVKAVLRRSNAMPDAPDAEDKEPAGKKVKIGTCWLDLASHKLSGDDGSDIPITAMEFDLLRALAEHPNRVLSRNQLLDLAHNRDWEPFDRSIDIRVARLRRKVEADPAKPQAIKTVRGVGYMFVPAGGAEQQAD